MKLRDYIISVKIGASFVVMIILLTVGTGSALWRLGVLEEQVQAQLRATPVAAAAGNSLQADQDKNIKELQHSHNVIRVLMITTNIVLLVLAVIIAMWTIRHVSVPLHAAAQFASQVADGNLAATLDDSKRSDEIGWLNKELKSITKTFREIAGGVRTRTDSFVSSTHTLNQDTNQLSDRTEAQASSLEETSASMEELAATVKENADNARQARQVAADASKVSMRGQELMGSVVTTMASISESSKKISEILGTIDSIAFQTNILALNAAVEAARAGEQGRGFAVVASEVRALAQRAGEAAKDIRKLIQESTQRANQGNALVSEAGATIGETARSVQRVTDIMDAIVNATREQSDGVHQVNVAITQMDSMTQQNAELASRSASAVRSLEDQSRELARLVSRFKFASQEKSIADALVPQPTIKVAVNSPPPRPSRASAPSVPNRSTSDSHAHSTDDWTEF